MKLDQNFLSWRACVNCWICCIRCSWQSAKQSHRCSAWDGAPGSNSGLRWRVRRGHWRNAVQTWSSQELEWTVRQSMHSQKNNSGVGQTVLRIFIYLYLHLIFLGFKVVLWLFNSFIEHPVHFSRTKTLAFFFFFIVLSPYCLGKSW